MFALAHLGCYNKVLQIEGLINHRNFFLTVLQARSRSWQIQCLVTARFLVHRQPSFCCVLTWWKGGKVALGGLFSVGINPIHEAPPLTT